MCCFWQLSERTATRDREETECRKGGVFSGRRGQNMTGGKCALFFRSYETYSRTKNQVRQSQLLYHDRICLLMYVALLFQ